VFSGNTLKQRYLYGPGADQVLAEDTGTTVRWALADHQGTIRDVTDANGAVINHLRYDSFGKVISQTRPTAFFRFGYTGRETDTESGLMYYRARYYDPGVGRFISEDPIGFDGGDTNLYRYVGNSPINFTDPSGLMFEEFLNIADSFARNWWEEAGEPFVRDPLGTIKNGFEGSQLYAEELQRSNAKQLADPNKPWYEKIVPSIAGGFNSLWTPCNAERTIDALSAALLVDGFFIQPLRSADALKPAGSGSVLFRDLRTLGTKRLQPYSSTPVGRRTPIGYEGPDAPQPNGAGRHTPQSVNSSLQPVQNQSGSVYGREYSGHAFDQMRNRGLVPSVVENTIKHGKISPGSTTNSIKIHDPANNITVILNSKSKVITVY
jgi:RHS repeat-associated protein